MPAIFSKNCVLSGEVDCYCLVCSKHLPAEHDVLAHIQDSEHKHNLSSHPYLDKFQQDRIRKVSGVYLCEVCDTTLPTAAKVRLHVTEHTHLERKRGRMLTRTRKCIVFHENIEITENAWNGLIDDTCVLCNVEFQHDSTHTAEQSHVLNLIKSRVIISAENDVYRHIEDSYQCLTCNMLISDNEMKEHLKCTQHKSALSKRDAHQDDVTELEPEGECLKDETVHEQDARDNDLVTDSNKDRGTDSITEAKANNTKITDGKTLYTKPVLMKNKQKKASSPSMSKPKDVESCTKQHRLSPVKDDKKAQKATTVDVDASPHSDKEVAGNKQTYQQNKKTDIKKTPMREFVEYMDFVEFVSDKFAAGAKTAQCVVFNNKFIIYLPRLFGLIKYHDIMICRMCNKTLSAQGLFMHFKSTQHTDIMENSYVINSLENEFVRELKPGLFDCTYCGREADSWAEMLKHLDSTDHKNNKMLHEALLRSYRTNFKHGVDKLPYNINAMVYLMLDSLDLLTPF